MGERQVTLNELIEQLIELRDTGTIADGVQDAGSLPVETEGCDCLGPCSGARFSIGTTAKLVILLERADR